MRVTYLLLFLSFAFIKSSAQHYHVNEDFNTGTLPTGWLNTAVTGTPLWRFGLNGASAHTGNQNLNGTSMAYFDDDGFGSSSNNNTVALTSPSFDNLNFNQTLLEFDYNFRALNGQADSFYVDVFDSLSWHRVFYRSTSDCGNWIQSSCIGSYPHATIDISAYKSSVTKVRFTYHDGNDWGWYVGFDNVQISSPIQNDLGVLEIINPNSTCGLSSGEQVMIKVKNFGSDSLSNFNVVVDIDNGGQILNETVLTTIIPGDSLNYLFQDTVNLSSVKHYNLKSYTILVADTNITNDTAYKVVENKPTVTIPYFESFEIATHNWQLSGTNSSLTRGIPNAIFIDTASHGLNAIVTNLTGPYNNNETSYLTSPCISGFNPSKAIDISMDLNYITELGFDKFWLEYSTDSGLSWAKVLTQSVSTNWYTNTVANVWEGNSNGWITAKGRILATNTSNTIHIRLVFDSDGSAVFEGVAIDQLYITEAIDYDLEVVSLEKPANTTTPACSYGIVFPIVKLRNIGNNQIDSAIVSYQVDNGQVITDTMNQLMNPNSVVNYQFTKPYNFSIPKVYSIDVVAKALLDPNPFNDTIKNITVTNINSSLVQTLPYIENFDIYTPGAGASDSIWNGWTRDPAGTFRWQVSNIATPSFGTGPSSDHTGSGGNFIFTEASLGLNGSIATLESPCISLTSANMPVLKFWYHKFGNSMANLFVDIYDGSNWINGISVIPGAQHLSETDPFSQQIVSLTPYIGNTIKLRFRSSGKIGFSSDMAIDDIEVIDQTVTSLLDNDTDKNNLLVYPNPNKGEFNLKVSSELVNKFYLLMDMSGKLIQQGTIKKLNSKINLSAKEKGVYFIKIEGINEVQKVVIY